MARNEFEIHFETDLLCADFYLKCPVFKDNADLALLAEVTILIQKKTSNTLAQL